VGEREDIVGEHAVPLALEGVPDTAGAREEVHHRAGVGHSANSVEDMGKEEPLQGRSKEVHHRDTESTEKAEYSHR
jgi:hypothetical protein